MTQCVQGLDDFGRPALSDVFNVFGFYRVAQRAVLFYMRRMLSWELRLRSGSKPPARQGHFVVTTELPEIQTVTVWTPCCVPMNAIINKKNLIEKPPCGSCQKAVRTLRTQLPLLDAKLLRFPVGWCYTNSI